MSVVRLLGWQLKRDGEMTAEVVILNKTAAAMAADSKGTIRVEGVVKTHDTLNKLFTLSKYHPVGAMIYGNAELMGVPWETIIKIYRDQLRDVALSKLNNYAHDFLFSVANDYKSSQKKQKDNAYWTTRDFFERILDQSDTIRGEARIDGEERSENESIETAYLVWSHAVERAHVLYGFRQISTARLLELYGDELTEACNIVFEDLVPRHSDFDSLVVSG